MYLALRPPWGGGAVATPPDAGPIASAPIDAGTGGKPTKKRRKRAAGTVAPTPGDPNGEWEEYEETEPLPVLTDADRKLEWRGEDTTPPPTKIDMAGGESRPLNDSEISGTINSQSSGVQDCVVQGATNTDLRATITIKMLVDGNGRVIKSRLQAPHYLFEKGLQGCAQRALSKMKFPATGAPTSVTFPITLG